MGLNTLNGRENVCLNYDKKEGTSIAHIAIDARVKTWYFWPKIGRKSEKEAAHAYTRHIHQVNSALPLEGPESAITPCR